MKRDNDDLIKAAAIAGGALIVGFIVANAINDTRRPQTGWFWDAATKGAAAGTADSFWDTIMDLAG